jgi:hypothetical protein
MVVELSLTGLIKTLTAPLAAIAERMAQRIRRRKPNLYIHFKLNSVVWCIAQQPQKQGPPREMMQIVFWANFNHDDPTQTLVITSAYPQGTTPHVGVMTFTIPPETMVNEQVLAIVSPIVGEKGKDWTGKIVLVDHFQREYQTKKITFKWVGA